MTSNQIALPYRRNSSPIAAGIVAAAFGLGALVGFGLPRLLDDRDFVGVAAGPVVAAQDTAGVADNNMSDAARSAMSASATATGFLGVANNNMSDAARVASLGTQVRP